MSATKAESALAPSSFTHRIRARRVAAASARLRRPFGARAMAERFASLSKPRIARAVWRTGLIVRRAKGPIWLQLSTKLDNPVKTARDFAARRLSRVAKIDREHADDVTVVASELVTNAIRHAAGNGPFWIGIAVRARWTHLYVIDADPTIPEPAPVEELALSGRGIPLVEGLGLLWFVAGVYGKTAHAVITRTGQELTETERDALMRLAIV